MTKFVNNVSSTLHLMTCVDRRITSAYHPQAIGLVERQNRTIKNSLVKVLDENPRKWPTVLEGVLFAHRVSRHSSTKYTPFFILYNREPILPVDLKYNLSSASAHNEVLDQHMFDAVLSSAITIRSKIHEDASTNILEAQGKQKRDYDRRHNSTTIIRIGDKVLLRNNKRTNRKGGRFTYRWLGPYVVKDLAQKGLATLVSNKGVELKKCTILRS